MIVLHLKYFLSDHILINILFYSFFYFFSIKFSHLLSNLNQNSFAFSFIICSHHFTYLSCVSTKIYLVLLSQLLELFSKTFFSDHSISIFNISIKSIL